MTEQVNGKTAPSKFILQYESRIKTLGIDNSILKVQ